MQEMLYKHGPQTALSLEQGLTNDDIVYIVYMIVTLPPCRVRLGFTGRYYAD